jgi:hypothetical protein
MAAAPKLRGARGIAQFAVGRRSHKREEPPLVPKERLFHCRDHAEIARGFRNA